MSNEKKPAPQSQVQPPKAKVSQPSTPPPTASYGTRAVRDSGEGVPLAAITASYGTNLIRNSDGRKPLTRLVPPKR